MALENISNNLVNWVILHGVKAALILVAAGILVKILKFFISKFLTKFVSSRAIPGKIKDKTDKERLKTLNNVFVSFLQAAVWSIAIITVLPEFGVNISPLLASIGIGGLALGFGARNLIQDYFSGFFILLEDQYRIGETVEILGKKGKVLDISLRRTVLENENEIYYIPNGQIKVVSNLSRRSGYAK